MMRVISSPSSSTTGLLTRILWSRFVAIGRALLSRYAIAVRAYWTRRCGRMGAMSFAVRELPGVTVFALCDGNGPFFRPRAEAFPDATSEAWAAADALDPAAVDADGRWVLHFHCYAIRFD